MANKKSIIAEFKEFISRGNVIDLAVGVIIGSAFTKIVTSLVNDMIMPVIGAIFGGIDFTSLRWVIRPGVEEDLEKGIKAVEEASLNYGNFIQCIVDFLLVALVIFIVIKLLNSFKRKKEVVEEVVEEPVIPEDILLLREIRDELKNK